MMKSLLGNLWNYCFGYLPSPALGKGSPSIDGSLNSPTQAHLSFTSLPPQMLSVRSSCTRSSSFRQLDDSTGGYPKFRKFTNKCLTSSGNGSRKSQAKRSSLKKFESHCLESRRIKRFLEDGKDAFRRSPFHPQSRLLHNSVDGSRENILTSGTPKATRSMGDHWKYMIEQEKDDLHISEEKHPRKLPDGRPSSFDLHKKSTISSKLKARQNVRLNCSASTLGESQTKFGGETDRFSNEKTVNQSRYPFWLYNARASFNHGSSSAGNVSRSSNALTQHQTLSTMSTLFKDNNNNNNNRIPSESSLNSLSRSSSGFQSDESQSTRRFAVVRKNTLKITTSLKKFRKRLPPRKRMAVTEVAGASSSCSEEGRQTERRIRKRLTRSLQDLSILPASKKLLCNQSCLENNPLLTPSEKFLLRALHKIYKVKSARVKASKESSLGGGFKTIKVTPSDLEILENRKARLSPSKAHYEILTCSSNSEVDRNKSSRESWINPSTTRDKSAVSSEFKSNACAEISKSLISTEIFKYLRSSDDDVSFRTSSSYDPKRKKKDSAIQTKWTHCWRS